MIKKSDLQKPLTIANSYLYSWELYADAESPTKKLYNKFNLKNRHITAFENFQRTSARRAAWGLLTMANVKRHERRPGRVNTTFAVTRNAPDISDLEPGRLGEF